MPEDGDAMMQKVRQLVAKHCVSTCTAVSVRDIEVSLCTIEHYCKRVVELEAAGTELNLTVFPGYRPHLDGKRQWEPEYPTKPVEQRTVQGNLPARWYTRVLKKKPAMKKPAASIAKRRPTPAFMAPGAETQQRAPRGSGSGRASTAKGQRTWSPKHPHQCTVCKRWFGARAKIHCGMPLQLNAGDMERRR